MAPLNVTVPLSFPEMFTAVPVPLPIVPAFEIVAEPPAVCTRKPLAV